MKVLSKTCIKGKITISIYLDLEANKRNIIIIIQGHDLLPKQSRIDSRISRVGLGSGSDPITTKKTPTN